MSSDFELPKNAEYKPAKQASLPSAVAEQPKEQVTESKEVAPKYNQEELLRIFDEVIFSGEYVEQVVIKNRLKASFRTRTASEIEAISLVVDGVSANLMATLNEKRSILNLQYALISYQGKDLKSMKLEDRAKFVGSIPGPVIGALLGALSKFDEKVFIACQEGEENF